MIIAWIAAAVLTAPPPPATRLTLGGREWTLSIEGHDAPMVEGLRVNTYIPWCFDGLKGRGVLKQLSLSVHWEHRSEPHVALAPTNLTTHQEDSGIISCIDASLRAFPPAHALDDDVLEFKFIRSRKS